MQQNILIYRIIIEPEISEDGSRVYVGFCPTLGISDYGDTVEDVLRSIKDGIELAIEPLCALLMPKAGGRKERCIPNQFLKVHFG